MTNPFDDPYATFSVLINAEEQRSLWPQRIAVPAGWTVEFGPGSRSDCLAFVDRTWTDLRPKRIRTPAPGGNAYGLAAAGDPSGAGNTG